MGVLTPADIVSRRHVDGLRLQPGTLPDTSTSVLRRALLATDLLAAAVASTAVFLIDPPSGTGLGVHPLVRISLLVLCTMLLLRQQGLYRSRTCAVRAAQNAHLGRVAVIIVAARAILAPGVDSGAQDLVLSVLIYLGALVLGRTVFDGWLRRQRTLGRFLRPVLVVGSGAEAQSLYRVTKDHPESGVRIIGITGDRPPGEESADAEHGPPWLGPLVMSHTVARALRPSAVIITATAVPWEQLNRLVRDLRRSGQRVLLSPGVQGVGPQRLSPSPLAYEPLLAIGEEQSLRRFQLVVKRILDLIVTSIVLVLALPLMAATALAIMISDGRPVLFRQQRVGRGGRPFMIFKFRTMVRDAESRAAELRAHNIRKGPLFKMANDPRVLRIGSFLRATSIDELPQLFNVLRGDMSLIGPRPALPAETLQFDQDLQHRLDVRPGLSGLWQIEGRDSPSHEVMQRLDVFYVENWSIGLDLAILVGTAGAVFGRAGRYLARRESEQDEEALW